MIIIFFDIQKSQFLYFITFRKLYLKNVGALNLKKNVNGMPLSIPLRVSYFKDNIKNTFV